MAQSRFSAPWSIIDRDESLTVVDASGLTICVLYFEDNEQRRNMTGRLTKKEAWNMARAFTTLPELRDEVRAVLASRGGEGA